MCGGVVVTAKELQLLDLRTFRVMDGLEAHSLKNAAAIWIIPYYREISSNIVVRVLQSSVLGNQRVLNYFVKQGTNKLKHFRNVGR